MMEGREGQGLNFWELHRKLAECYQQDVQYGRRRAPSTASVSMRLPSSSELPVVRPVISPPSPTGLRVSTTRRTLESSNEVGHSTRDAVASRPEVGRGKSESSDLAKPREGEEGLKPREAWCPVLEHKSAKLMARAGSMASLKATVTTLSESISVEAAETWSFVLHPAGRLRTVWDALTVIALVLDIILIPLEFFGIQELQGVTGATVITILFWSLDVVLSFRSGSYKKGVLVMEPKTIARDYARSWLVPDLALVGLDWLALAVNAFSEDASQVLWLLRLLRLVRVLRLGKVSRSALNLKEAMQWTVNRRGSVAMNLGLLLLLNHMIACGWWAFGHAWGDASGWSVTNFFPRMSSPFHFFRFSGVPFVSTTRQKKQRPKRQPLILLLFLITRQRNYFFLLGSPCSKEWSGGPKPGVPLHHEPPLGHQPAGRELHGDRGHQHRGADLLHRHGSDLPDHLLLHGDFRVIFLGESGPFDFHREDLIFPLVFFVFSFFYLSFMVTVPS
ncbi:unnamed protein product [Effrenium voratum]|nr:unnamed protein product [Effrenium voratum]